MMRCLGGAFCRTRPKGKFIQMSVEQHIKLPEGSIEKSTTTLNLGPTHPATHGVFQNILELDGERIVSAEQTVGYIHRA